MFALRLYRSFANKLISGNVQPIQFTENTEELKDVKITTGKAWSSDLLRLKSHEDLTKLWYVLLKEQNLILADNQFKVQLMVQKGPQHRMKKVKQSMARLLTVIREREIVREKY